MPPTSLRTSDRETEMLRAVLASIVCDLAKQTGDKHAFINHTKDQISQIYGKALPPEQFARILKESDTFLTSAVSLLP